MITIGLFALVILGVAFWWLFRLPLRPEIDNDYVPDTTARWDDD